MRRMGVCRSWMWATGELRTCASKSSHGGTSMRACPVSQCPNSGKPGRQWMAPGHAQEVGEGRAGHRRGEDVGLRGDERRLVAAPGVPDEPHAVRVHQPHLDDLRDRGHHRVHRRDRPDRADGRRCPAGARSSPPASTPGSRSSRAPKGPRSGARRRRAARRCRRSSGTSAPTPSRPDRGAWPAAARPPGS